MAVPDLPADTVEPKPVAGRLQEKVPALIKSLVVIVELLVGMEWNQDGLCLLILSCIFPPPVLPVPSPMSLRHPCQCRVSGKVP